MPLQRETLFFWQNLIAKVLWHLKKPDLPKASSQSPRIPLWHLKSHTLPKAPSQSPEFSGAEFGNQNAEFLRRLWHLKYPNFPKAVSQSPRIPLWHLKSPYLTKRPEPKPQNSACVEFGNSVLSSKARTGKLSKNSALQNS